MTQLRAGAATDPGRVRQGNEDASLLADEHGLWAVADGVGGHQAGEVASQLAIRVLEEAYTAAGEATEDALADAAAHANTVVYETAEADPNLRGMGTTLVAIARTEDDELAYVNVGDSRIYLFRDGELQRLTIDHSLVEELVQEGTITPTEARTHPRRNIVTRALGMHPIVQVDAATIVPYVGDRYVLCSDGLSDEVDDDGIAAVLRRLADPDEAAEELVRVANANGGHDNITVVIVDVVDDGGRAQAASRVVGERDLAGFSTAVDDDEDAGAATEPPPLTRRERRRLREKPRALTWRVGAFAVLLVAILLAAAGAIGWYARNTYYVGVDGEQVTIFKGKPDGVLWFDPTVERTTDLTTRDIGAEYRDDVDRGVEFGTLGEAEAYVERITPTTTTTTTTTSTTTTSTSVPPPTLPTPDPAN